MAHNKLVSVIVPVYNVEKYLVYCIDSILAQSYQNLQIILVDDGSTDSCPSICDSYKEKDRRIVVLHKQNGGLSDARNAGLDIAEGEYICFVDSDDWIAPVFIEKLYKLITKYKVQISACGFVAAFKNITINQPEKSGLYSAEEAIKKLIVNNDLHDHVTTKMFHRSLWEGIRFPKDVVFEDIRTTYRLLLIANGIYVSNECLYWYRQRGAGIARGSFTPKRFQMVDAVQEMGQDPRISQSPECRTLLEKRLLKVKALIVRSMALSNSTEPFIIFRNQVNSYVSEIRLKRRVLLFDKTQPRAVRTVALLSSLGSQCIFAFFRLPIVRQYYSKHYEYYD